LFSMDSRSICVPFFMDYTNEQGALFARKQFLRIFTPQQQLSSFGGARVCEVRLKTYTA